MKPWLRHTLIVLLRLCFLTSVVCGYQKYRMMTGRSVMSITNLFVFLGSWAVLDILDRVYLARLKDGRKKWWQRGR